MAAVPRIDGQDKVIAAAQQIVKSLATSKNAAEDMIRILSGFDNRLNILSPPTVDGEDEGNDTQNDRNTPDEFLNTYSTVEDVVLRWDSSDALLFDASTLPDDRQEFLSAVDELVSLTVGNVSETVQARAETLLQIAMVRLEEEFRHLMIQHSVPLDPAALRLWNSSSVQESSASAPKPSLSFASVADDLDSSSSPHHPHDHDDSSPKLEDSSGIGEVIEDKSVELVHFEAIGSLRAIADRMVAAGYNEELCQVYSSLRRDVLDEWLSILDVDRVSIEEVQRLEWRELDGLMKRWAWAVKAVTHSLLDAERKLADQVFIGNEEFAVQCFIEAAKGCVLQMLNFGDAVAVCRRSPEKLFRIIGMYEALADVMPDLESMFPGMEGNFVVSEAWGVLRRLGDAIRGTFKEFENAVGRETSKKAVGGEIHPITRYVMNYIKLLVCSCKLLDQLLDDGDVDVAESLASGGSEEYESMTPLGRRILLIMTQLESNIEQKSKLYEDTALRCIFLMNNLWYIVQKVKADKELQALLGDHWVRRRRGQIRQYSTSYLRHAWTKVLSYLKDDGLTGSGSSSNVSRVALKEKFKNFNLAYEEIYRTQSAWRVPDPQLREELRISISELIVPAYRAFVGRFSSHLEGGRHTGKYIKYTPEDLENHLVDLFEGSPWQQNHPRRKSG